MLIAALALFCGCQHDVLDEVEFNVTLDKSNTYIAGEPVRFNFSGNSENILFYSGEEGAEYEFRDRYSIPSENIRKANLSMTILSQYGVSGALEVWITDRFDGLAGDDGELDRELVRSLNDSLETYWTKVGYEDPKNGGTVRIDSLDIMDYKDNFCVAFHWNPSSNTSSQRTYRVNGSVSLEIEGKGETEMTFSDLEFTTVMMNEELEPYVNDKRDGSIVLDDPAYALFFKGIAGYDEASGKGLPFCLDGWAVSKPRPLNRVENAKGLVIKNVQNYLDAYEYVWSTPGTYKVTFVAANANYQGSSEIVKDFTINIVDKF